LTRRTKIHKLTLEMVSKSRVIAKGRKIRDLKRLRDTYGGVASQWVKKSSPSFKIGSELFEYHWYEHHGIGRFEIKLKKVKEI